MIALSRDFVTVREASNSLSQVIDRAAQQPQVITRSGKPVAVVVDPATWDAAQRALELEAESLRVLAEAAATRAARGEAVSGEAARAWLADWRAAHGYPAFDPATADLSAYLDEEDAEPRS